MTTADGGSLPDLFRDLDETDRRGEGVWFEGSLADGRSAHVVLVAPAVAAKMSAPDKFFGSLERTSALRVDGVPQPILWGRAEASYYVAYRREVEPSPVSGGVKPSAEVALAGAQVATALASVHGTGLVHGAFSPSRLMPSARGGVALGGVGLHAALAAGGLGVRDAAATLSDIAYMSPEARADLPLDARSDVYSLGATLFELLTGRPPFGGRTTSYVMASVLAEDDAGSRKSGPESAAVVDAVLRAIERAPDDRWPNAASFAAALEAESEEPTEAKGGTGRSLRDIFSRAWFPARRSRE